MSRVLKYRVLELELASVEDLSPVRLLRVAEDPALIVLGFDDEHAEPGDENVINLG